MRGYAPADRSPADEFGASVSIDGRLLAIGIPGDDTVAPDAGAVAVFVRDSVSNVWYQKQIFVFDAGQEEDRWARTPALCVCVCVCVCVCLCLCVFVSVCVCACVCVSL